MTGATTSKPPLVRGFGDMLNSEVLAPFAGKRVRNEDKSRLCPGLDAVIGSFCDLPSWSGDQTEPIPPLSNAAKCAFFEKFMIQPAGGAPQRSGQHK
jgi:hypothetical protein